MIPRADLKPDSGEIGIALHRALAALVCTHTEDYEPACPLCLEATRRLAKPVAKAIMTAASYQRTRKADAYVAAGQAFECLVNAAEGRHTW